MAIRKILSRMFITLFVSAILAAVTAAQAQSDNEKLRSMAQLYGVATYALGANEQCDLLDQGEYRGLVVLRDALTPRSEEHTSELQSLMRISYAVFCLKKKNKKNIQ